MQMPASPPVFRSGFVAVLGQPNVGKSTLINAFLGQKVAAVSPRPQTTRRRQLGIITLEHAQVIFMDTPGIHQPHHKLGEKMNHTALEALLEADLVLFIVDASQPPDEEDRMLANLIKTSQRQADTLMALNKIDLVGAEDLPPRLFAYGELLAGVTVMPISASRGDQRPELFEMILSRLPEGPLYYPDDQVTDLYEREIAADLIREAALHHLRDEVPHGIAVRIDDYKDRDAGNAYIAATLLLERETHKPIVIGRGGSVLKKIGTSARREIEAMTGRKVYLELHVKVRKNWRDDEAALKLLGFDNPNS